jgi:hypothetical protein
MIGEKPALQDHSAKHQVLFNIHNPNQDHRDRNACVFRPIKASGFSS